MQGAMCDSILKIHINCSNSQRVMKVIVIKWTANWIDSSIHLNNLLLSLNHWQKNIWSQRNGQIEREIDWILPQSFLKLKVSDQIIHAVCNLWNLIYGIMQKSIFLLILTDSKHKFNFALFSESPIHSLGQSNLLIRFIPHLAPGSSCCLERGTWLTHFSPY